MKTSIFFLCTFSLFATPSFAQAQSECEQEARKQYFLEIQPTPYTEGNRALERAQKAAAKLEERLEKECGLDVGDVARKARRKADRKLRIQPIEQPAENDSSQEIVTQPVGKPLSARQMHQQSVEDCLKEVRAAREAEIAKLESDARPHGQERRDSRQARRQVRKAFESKLLACRHPES